MKIEEAIKIVEALDRRGHFADGDEVTPALRLLIGAGKVIERNRQNHPDIRFSLLPGETKD